MRQLITWMRENLALPVGMVLATACIAFVWQLTEIDAHRYHVLEQMYLDGTPQFRSAVQDCCDDSINEWEYTGLIRLYWTDARALRLPPLGESDSRSTARAALWETVKRNSRGAPSP